MLFVSHDRQFINAVATKVVELKDGVTKQYGGNYDFYKEQKDIEHQAALEKYQKSKMKRSDSRRQWLPRQENSNMFMSTSSVRITISMLRDFFRNSVSVKLGQKAKNLETRLEKLEDVERPAV
jgi:ATPase subunit of ABC transporter with duplicated ATPase domains